MTTRAMPPGADAPMLSQEEMNAFAFLGDKLDGPSEELARELSEEGLARGLGCQAALANTSPASSVCYTSSGTEQGSDMDDLDEIMEYGVGVGFGRMQGLKGNGPTDADAEAYESWRMQAAGFHAYAPGHDGGGVGSRLSMESIGLDMALLHEMDELIANSPTSEGLTPASTTPAIEYNSSLHASGTTVATPLAPSPRVCHGGSGATDALSFLFAHPDPVLDMAKAPSLIHPETQASPVSSSLAMTVAQPEHARLPVNGGDGDGDVTMSMNDDDDEQASENDVYEMELLRRQLKYLEAQHEFLVYRQDAAASDSPQTAATSREQAVESKAALEQVQQHKLLLVDAAEKHLKSLKYMESMLFQSSLNHYRSTLMTPMESFIHLTRDPVERRMTLLALREEKLDAAERFVDFHSRNIDVERQFFYLDTFERFGKHYTVDFSVSKLENTTVEEVATAIYNHFATTNDNISNILGSVENREYFDGRQSEFMHARFVDRINTPKRSVRDRGFVVQESNTVYYAKHSGGRTVFASDYIDRDDLHPYRSSGRIRKDTTVGIVIEPAVNAQGHEAVILKRFSFVRHHFKTIAPTPDLVQAITTKVILWGQAVRFCISGRPRGHRAATFPPQLLSRARRHSLEVQRAITNCEE